MVKKLEELGIGRPSTYAPTISTIQNRGYVVKDEIEGVNRDFSELTLKSEKIKETLKSEIVGAMKGKLSPTDIGSLVNDFLVKYFEEILDFNFTADVEKEFDLIAEGKAEWNHIIKNFYTGFHEKVVHTTENADRFSGERLLGVDPASGKNVSVRIGKFGPIVQIGEASDEDKPRFAGLQKGQSITEITFDEAMALFKFPRQLGEYENYVVTVAIGRFGPYIRHNNKFYSLGKEDLPSSIELNRALELIAAKRQKDIENTIQTFEEEPELIILNGRFGPYISYQKKNYKISKTTDPKTLSLEECMEIIEKTPIKKGKTPAKKATAKKAPAKKKVAAKKPAAKKKAAPKKPK